MPKPRARVGVEVDVLEPLGGQVRVDLRGGDVGVPEHLLYRAQVATVPGIVFGAQGESHLRFSFSLPIETIEAGLDSLRRNL